MSLIDWLSSDSEINLEISSLTELYGLATQMPLLAILIVAVFCVSLIGLLYRGIVIFNNIRQFFEPSGPSKRQMDLAIAGGKSLSRSFGLKLHASEIEHSSVSERRNAVGLRPNWNLLLSGVYLERPEILEPALSHLAEWQENQEGAALHIPIFWLEGRWGEGKSTLLLQLAHAALTASHDADFYLATNGMGVIHILDDIARKKRKNQAVIVVDNLHEVSDIHAWTRSLTAHSSGNQIFSIMTCGSTLERKEFSRRASGIKIEPHVCPPTTPFEKAALSDWLGRDDSNTTEDDDLLVQFLFELAVDDISEFSVRLENSLGKVGMLKAVKRILIANVFDIPSPIALLPDTHTEAKFREISSGESLQFEIEEIHGLHGIRIAHRMIALQLCTRLNNLETMPIELRIRFLAEEMAITLNCASAVSSEFLEYSMSALSQGLPKFLGTSNLTSNNELEFFRTLANMSDSTVKLYALRWALAAARKTAVDNETSLDLQIAVRAELKEQEALGQARFQLASELLLYELIHGSASVTSIDDFEQLLFSPAHLEVGAQCLRDIAQSYQGESINRIFVEWLERCASAPNSLALLHACLEKQPVDPQIWDTGVKIVSEGGFGSNASNVNALLYMLLFSETQKWKKLGAVLTKCIAMDDEGYASNLIELALSRGAWRDPGIEEAIFLWIKRNPFTSGWSNAVAATLRHAERREEVIEYILSTVSLSEEVELTSNLLESMLANCDKRQRPLVVNLARAWLQTTSSTGGQNVLSAILANTRDHSDEIVDLALDWANRNLDRPIENVLSKLVSITKARDDVVSLSERWANEVADDAAARRLRSHIKQYDPMPMRQTDRIRVAKRAVSNASQALDKRELSEAHVDELFYVLRRATEDFGLLDLFVKILKSEQSDKVGVARYPILISQANQNDDLVQFMFEWAINNPESPAVGNVWEVIVQKAGGRVDILRAAKEAWFSGNVPGTLIALIAGWLKSEPSDEDALSELRFSYHNARNVDDGFLLLRAFLKRLSGIEKYRNLAISYAYSWFSDIRKADARIIALLSEVAKSIDEDQACIDFLFAIDRRSKKNQMLRRNAPKIYSNCAAIIYSLSKRNPRFRTKLCRLISLYWSSYSDTDIGRTLWKERMEWPSDCRYFLLTAVLLDESFRDSILQEDLHEAISMINRNEAKRVRQQFSIARAEQPEIA